MKRPQSAKAFILIFCFPLLFFPGCGTDQKSPAPAVVEQNPSLPLTDLQQLEMAFQKRWHGLRVTQQGRIIKVLEDDRKGSFHQRCIVELPSGQTLLVAHNIDIAPPVPDLVAGEMLTFQGEYEWNKNGGTIHWTHHDPQGRHEGGWLLYRGKKYQ